ncbi:hypothetical protein [Halorubrum laminariae]|uniref:Uncharacterized protein n=1 Tax=Halorubrum laminariae TaxID=1433523 RepID=A0ABD6C154_9EURY|nr:hypothetical protein [Halorubrum laminariae]
MGAVGPDAVSRRTTDGGSECPTGPPGVGMGPAGFVRGVSHLPTPI